MSDTFEVGLSNNVSGPAREAADALAALKRKADEATKSVRATGEQLGDMPSLSGEGVAPLLGDQSSLLPSKRTRQKQKQKEETPLAPTVPEVQPPTLDRSRDGLAPGEKPKKGKGLKNEFDAHPVEAAGEDLVQPIFKGITAPKNAGKLANGIVGLINKVGSYGNKIQSEFGDEIGGFALQAVGEKAKEGVKNLAFKTAGGLVSGLGSMISLPFSIAASATSALISVMVAGTVAAVTFTAAVGGLGLELVKMSAEARMARDEVEGLGAGLDLTPVMKGSRDVADVIGTSTNKIATAFLKLRREGVSTGFAQDLVQGMADMDIMNGKGAGDQFSQAILGLADKNSAGLEQISKLLGDSGKKALYANLAKQLNVQGSGDDLKAQIEAQIKAGKLDKAGAISAALSALSAQTGKDVGGVAKDFADKTLAGNVDALKNSWQDLLTDISSGQNSIKFLRDLRESLDQGSESGKKIRAALKPITQLFDDIVGKIDIKSIIGDITKVFDPATESGARFQGILGKVSTIFDKLLGSGKKGGFTFVDALEVGLVVIEKVVDVALWAAGVFEEASPKVRSFFDAIGGGDVASAAGSAILGSIGGMIPVIGSVIGEFGLLLAIIDTLPGEIEAQFSDWGSLLTDVGPQLVAGLWDGLSASWSSMLADFGELVAQLPASVKSILGIHSPSRVFAELGGYTMAGFEQGVDKGAGGVQDAVAAAVSPPAGISPPTFAPMAGTAPGGVSGSMSVGDIQIQIHSASGDPQKIADEVLSALIDKLEALGLERGAKP